MIFKQIEFQIKNSNQILTNHDYRKPKNNAPEILTGAYETPSYGSI